MNKTPPDPKTILVFVGPTASGKSAAAFALAGKIGAEIVNADSRQIYRYLDIGTAKPLPSERKKIPHHLYDFLDPRDSYSAGDYRRDAEATLREILGRGKTPVIVGGTGLYLRSLFRGLSTLPPRDPKVRERLTKEAESLGREALHGKLESVDPESAKKIPAQNIQRVVRALEVYEITGRPLSRIHAESPTPALGLSARFYGLAWEREALKERIRLRTKIILSGLIQETRQLIEQGYGERDPGMEGIGYRETLQFLKGGMSREALFDAVLKGTLAYAKRQLTWFRADPDIEWIPVQEPFDPEDIAENLAARRRGD